MASHKGEDELLVCGRAGRKPSKFLRFLYKNQVRVNLRLV